MLNTKKVREMMLKVENVHFKLRKYEELLKVVKVCLLQTVFYRLRKCVKRWERMLKVEEVLKYEKMYQKQRKCAKSWDSMPKVEKVCQKS